MTTSKKALCVVSLVVAGTLSIFLSFLGGFGLLWSGFPQKDHSFFVLAMFLPFFLALPLFILSACVSKTALYALWAAVPFPWIAVIEMSIPNLRPGPLGFFESMWACAYASVPLAILAALVQFGAHFYEFTCDSNWVRWKEVKHDLAA